MRKNAFNLSFMALSLNTAPAELFTSKAFLTRTVRRKNELKLESSKLSVAFVLPPAPLPQARVINSDADLPKGFQVQNGFWEMMFSNPYSDTSSGRHNGIFNGRRF